MRSDNGSPAIETRGLSRRFGDLAAVDGVDLSVERGELFALLGPNGAGKTTTIKMLCCLLRPTSGSATVMGNDVRADPLAVKKVVDISPQETAIAEHLNAWENLELMAGLNAVDRTKARGRAGELLELVGLVERASEKVKRYSGGMKRRLSIAMALISDPEVLILDEPTLGLDAQSRRAIWNHIEDLKGTKTILHTTHYLEEADALADRIAIIDEGKVIASGTPAELKRSISDGQAVFVEASGLTEESIAALGEISTDVRRTNGGLEIGGDIHLYDVVDILRPRGVVVEAISRRRVTLDDVFVELTGKELRE
ncbi:MAG: ATP-binding cassette domain-containing protein [Acidimicrobiia bacterium]